MTKKTSPKQPSEEIQMANPDIKVFIGIKLKYLSEKQNDYGCNHMFQLLDETPLNKLIELKEDMKKLFGNIMVNTI